MKEGTRWLSFWPVGMSYLLCENGATVSVAAICDHDIAENHEPRNNSDLVKIGRGCEETGASWNKVIFKN